MHRGLAAPRQRTGPQDAGRLTAHLDHPASMRGDEYLAGLVRVPVGSCAPVEGDQCGVGARCFRGVANASCSTVTGEPIGGRCLCVAARGGSDRYVIHGYISRQGLQPAGRRRRLARLERGDP